MNSYIVVFLFLIGWGSPASAFDLRQLKKPQSFIVDPQTGIYYVSNMDRKTHERYGQAFISKIGPDGKWIDRRFIGSGKKGVVLDAPKGLSLYDNDLYTVDIRRVLRFNKNTGNLLGIIDLTALGAVALSDSTWDDKGRLYVCDKTTNTIFKIDPQNQFSISRYFKGSELKQPNGLLYDSRFKRFIIASWETGHLLALNPDRNVIPLFKDNALKQLSGVAFDRNHNLVFSDFIGGKVYRLKNFSSLEILRENIVTPADVAVDIRNNQVLVPSLKGNLVFTIPLN